MNPANKERYMYILGGFVVGLAIAIVGCLVFYPVPVGNKDIVNVSLGALLGMAVNVVGYYFGSSKSSADKNDLLANNAPKPPTP
jgi:hypothetical protein